ncbi:substrate-binding domain-containing protein [Austwickia chelonae]|uniref:substrate-binding domain-containing protein n=1 Tax=Austwickia chelonae TaxID=100225 RepID=UPI0013C31DFA|nr:substrate-binding domain-containing protein [Austwickia chelonae]
MRAVNTGGTKLFTVAVAAALVATSAACSTRENKGGESASSATPPPYAPIAAGSSVALALPLGSRVEASVKAELTKAGFKVISRMSDRPDDQDHFVGLLLEEKPQVLVVDALDGGRIAERLSQAKKAGVVVIATGALPRNSESIDYYVGSNPSARGKAQGEAVATAVAGRRPGEPSRVEIFAGRKDDVTARLQFDATIAELKPKQDQKLIEFPSGRTDFDRAAVESGEIGKAVEQLFRDRYTDSAPEALVAQHDGAALAAVKAVAELKKSVPVVVGAGSSAEGVRALMAGQLAATTWEDQDRVGAELATFVSDLTKKDRPNLDKQSLSTGKREVGTRLIMPVTSVTRAMAKDVYAKDEVLNKLTG